ncbi:MAG: GNAT family N-acetyltransferase [Jatrophihabitantaceae bacterium]
MGQYRGIELDDLVLTGNRLRLRPWQLEDAPTVHTIMQSQQMHRFLALPDPYTPEVAREFVTDRGLEGRGDGNGIGCAVVAIATGAIVGAAALRLPAGMRKEAEIGYWVAPTAQGNGYATEATQILSGWGFEHGLPRVELCCDVRNVASAATALRAGFTFEGVRRGFVNDASGRHALAMFARTDFDDGEPIEPAFARLPAEGLSDGAITLRTMQADDAVSDSEQENDPVSVSVGFTGKAGPQRGFLDKADRAGLDFLVGTVARCTVIDDETGRFAGSIQMRKAGPPGVGGIGYTIHPDFRGRGYTTRALRLLAAWAFDVAGYARLELGAKTKNVASQRAAAAAGFEPDGVRAARLRNPDGSYSDEVRFTLINPTTTR